MSDAKPASVYTPQTDEKRPTWATLLGIACGIAILGFIALGIALLGTIEWLTVGGFVLFCLAGLIASAGGYVYFLYEGGE